MMTVPFRRFARLPRPCRVPQPGRTGVIVVGSAEAGLEVARRYPAVRVQVFERDWRAVDAGRALADAAGLGGRVTVHHRGAAGLAGEPSPPAAAA